MRGGTVGPPDMMSGRDRNGGAAMFIRDYFIPVLPSLAERQGG